MLKFKLSNLILMAGSASGLVYVLFLASHSEEQALGSPAYHLSEQVTPPGPTTRHQNEVQASANGAIAHSLPHPDRGQPTKDIPHHLGDQLAHPSESVDALTTSHLGQAYNNPDHTSPSKQAAVGNPLNQPDAKSALPQRHLGDNTRDPDSIYP